MFNKPSLITRIAIGKAVGLVIGLIGFFTLPVVAPESSMFLRIGLVLWYTTMGMMIGVFGVFTRHPMLKLPMPWWIRSSMLGAWLNFVLVFFAYDQMYYVLHAALGDDAMMQSPFWFTLEGALIGLLIGYAANRLGGEGKATVDEME